MLELPDGNCDGNMPMHTVSLARYRWLDTERSGTHKCNQRRYHSMTNPIVDLFLLRCCEVAVNAYIRPL